MTEPRTAAGRALVDYPMLTAGIGSDRDDDRLREAVIAIEAEARTEGHKEGYLSRAQDEEGRR